MRAGSIDGRNRRVWGAAAPYFRDLIGPDPPIPDDDEASNRFLRPDGETRHPWPVEPRWRLWKRRELRRRQPEAREFEAKRKAAGGTLRVRGGVICFDPEEQATADPVGGGGPSDPPSDPEARGPGGVPAV